MEGNILKIYAKSILTAAALALLSAAPAIAAENAAKPAAAAEIAAGAESAASAGAKSVKLGGPTIGAGLCKIDTNDIDFGTISAGSKGLINIPGKIHLSCIGVTTRTKFCIMLYPSLLNEHDMFGDTRVLLFTGASEHFNAYLSFQFMMDGQIWGGGAANNDYGAPYAAKTGIYLLTGFDLAYTAQINMEQHQNYTGAYGIYANQYNVKLVYTNTPFEGQASSLCNAKRGPGLLVNTYSTDIVVHAKIAPAE